MYYWHVFLWENGKKSTEYTDYVVAPIFLEDKLDETLDSGEIILMGMPIATKSAFPPKTKFRIERYNTAEMTDEPKYWDMVVEHDDVEEYTGCPELCTHRIHLIEASVVAQGMHVDNIALTYELQDVTLNYRTTGEDNGKVDIPQETLTQGWGSPDFQYGGVGKYAKVSGFLVSTDKNIANCIPESPSITYYETCFRYVWQNVNELNSLTKNLAGNKIVDISIMCPRLYAEIGDGEKWISIGEIPVKINAFCYKYQQRATKDGNGIFVPNNNFEPVCLTSFSIVDSINYPSDDTSFVASRGQTRIHDGRLQFMKPKGRTIQSANGDFSPQSIDDNYLTGLTWGPLWDGNDTKDSTSNLSPKCQGEGKNYEFQDISEYRQNSSRMDNISFQTLTISDSEALYYDEEGNPWITYYAYKISLNSMANSLPTHVNYSATGSWNSAFVTSQTNFTFKIEELDDKSMSLDEISVNFFVSGMVADASAGKFLTKPKKYSCYDMFRKAMTTIDTYVIDTRQESIDEVKFPIYINPNWEELLKKTPMHETIFEQKNLWEVLLQIGYYIHSIPYLEFASDGTDRFELNFRQLGKKAKKDDNSNKITVFNSLNLSDYFAQFDAYATNFFSPQNIVEEWLVPKTSDGTYLVCNNNAELQTSYPIMEILVFEINGKNALSYIFEKSVYEILTSDNPIRLIPAKGNSLYYVLGENQILGLNYTPPEVSQGTYEYSLKEICTRIGIPNAANLKFNDLTFHIKYRTQDELRVSQFRPDLEKFVKNSSYEKYPHHEQYYGQQDKIVDSERFSANLFGQLIRVGNVVYQRQEYVKKAGDEKESGDLVDISGEPYYVTEVENEYYPDAILQKVTYSKNFNRLSQIVTIPSEPRFYEVSERSKVRREIRIMDFLKLTNTKPDSAVSSRFFNSNWQKLIKKLIFNDGGNSEIPNFAYTKFIADKNRDHEGHSIDKLFPSSETDRSNPNALKPKSSSDHAECIVPLLRFPLQGGIVFEWGMEDNFKAGDFIDHEITNRNESNVDKVYLGQQSLRYVDIFGRADLFTFGLFNKNWTAEEARLLPKAVSIPNSSDCPIRLLEPHAIALDKDNREALSFNYQINLLHEDKFITFSNLFGEKQGSLKICFLSEPVSLFDENVDLHSNKTVLFDEISPEISEEENVIKIGISVPADLNKGKIRSVVLYETDGENRYAVIAENIKDGSEITDLWIVAQG